MKQWDEAYFKAKCKKVLMGKKRWLARLGVSLLHGVQPRLVCSVSLLTKTHPVTLRTPRPVFLSVVSNHWTGFCWTGLTDWIAGLDCWTGLTDWIDGLDC